MEVQTFVPTYTDTQQKRTGPSGGDRNFDQEGGQRVRIRHDILGAAEKRCPEGVTLKAFLNEVLAERFL
jgi:hypothetical protein